MSLHRGLGVRGRVPFDDASSAGLRPLLPRIREGAELAEELVAAVDAVVDDAVVHESPSGSRGMGSPYVNDASPPRPMRLRSSLQSVSSRRIVSGSRSTGTSSPEMSFAGSPIAF